MELVGEKSKLYPLVKKFFLFTLGRIVIGNGVLPAELKKKI